MLIPIRSYKLRCKYGNASVFIVFNGEFSLKDMARVMVHACSQMISIEQAAKRFRNAPQAPAIRFLREKLDIVRIENAANKILQGLAQLILSGKFLEFAMDLTYIPYHGSRYTYFQMSSSIQCSRGCTLMCCSPRCLFLN